MTLMVQTRLETPVPVTGVAVNALRKALCGTLCLPGDPGNAMIDRRPALIVQAVGAVDVVQTVNFAREHGALLGCAVEATTALEMRCVKAASCWTCPGCDLSGLIQ
jgi:hypothetical protein